MFSDYVKKLSAVQKLTPTEEEELWRAYKECGNEAARQRIIEAYQPLVFREVMPYRALSAVMDAVQEGTVGLIEAVERYDPSRGAAFSLYAVHRIRGRILDFLRCEGQVDLPCLEVETETHETACVPPWQNSRSITLSSVRSVPQWSACPRASVSCSRALPLAARVHRRWQRHSG